MKKYYLEFICNGDYKMQSKWFDTKDELLEKYEDFFDYVDVDVDVYLMSSVWNTTDDTYSDIEFDEKL